MGAEGEDGASAPAKGCQWQEQRVLTGVPTALSHFFFHALTVGRCERDGLRHSWVRQQGRVHLAQERWCEGRRRGGMGLPAAGWSATRAPAGQAGPEASQRATLGRGQHTGQAASPVRCGASAAHYPSQRTQYISKPVHLNGADLLPSTVDELLQAPRQRQVALGIQVALRPVIEEW